MHARKIPKIQRIQHVERFIEIFFGGNEMDKVQVSLSHGHLLLNSEITMRLLRALNEPMRVYS